MSSQSSHHPQEVLLAQFSLYVHKGGLKPDSFHFISFSSATGLNLDRSFSCECPFISFGLSSLAYSALKVTKNIDAFILYDDSPSTL